MKILLCTNEKKHVEGAITFSLDLLKGSHPEVTLFHVQSEDDNEDSGDEVLARGESIIEIFHPKIKVHTKKRTGNVFNEILFEANSGDYDLLVMGSKGASETIIGVSEFIISDTVRRVIQFSPISTFVIKEPRMMNKVLIFTDGSASAKGAVTFWAQLNKTKEPQATVLHAIPEIYTRFQDVIGSVSRQELEFHQNLPSERTKCLNQAHLILTDSGIEAKVKLREGDPVEEILEESKQGYDLIIMGFGSEKDANWSTLGRQAIKVIEHSLMPVLVWKE